MRLTTGAQSYEKVQEQNNWDNQKRINMFKIQGLYPMFLRQGKQFNGIILPAFDSSLDPNDTARPASYESYRSRTFVDQKTGYGQFTGWFTSVIGYSYYGVGKSTFISPSTVDAPDPIVELRNYVFANNKATGDTTYMKLTENKDPRNGPTELPRASRMALMNVWAGTTNDKAKDQSVTNRVLVLREQAFTKLRHDLDTLRPATIEQPLDPDWPHFMYGDLTSPVHGGIQFSTMTYMPEGGGFAGPALDLGKVVYRAGKHEVSVVRNPINQLMLEGRYDLGDADNVLHIPSYEEIVDLLVEEAIVPYELVQRVCSPKYQGTFPVSPGGAITIAKTAAAPVQPAVAGGGNVLRQSQPAAPTAVAAAPYSPTPVPQAPEYRLQAALDPNDHIPGLEPIDDPAPSLSQPASSASNTEPSTNAAWTEEDEKALKDLNERIQSNKAELSDFSVFKELTMKKAAAGL